jgi:hypothetical protein
MRDTSIKKGRQSGESDTGQLSGHLAPCSPNNAATSASGATAGPIALTNANDVLLDAVQPDKKIFGSVSITSWIKEHGGTYRGFRELFPAISRRASGQS